ncbi:MAG: IS630 family transposase [Solirubrobacteraceae bacterium]
MQADSASFTCEVRVPRPKYIVNLTEDERAQLLQLVRTGRQTGRIVARARVLLKADEGLSDPAVAAAVDVGIATVHRIRQRCLEVGPQATLRERPRGGSRPKFSAKQHAHVIALACSAPPTGQARWTLRLLADRVVELGLAERCSYETIRRALKKNAIKPWQTRQWCIPTVGAAFVARMEDVLDLYAEPYAAARPVVCFDELPVQLVAEVRPARPATPAHPRREDYEYVRQGVANVFLLLEPLRGWRHLTVTAHRCKLDFAAQMRWLVDAGYPEAEEIQVVLDNLSTHTPEALYESFPAAEARRLLRVLTFHYTPKHGSWLNMAEIELSILSRACLGLRIPTPEALRRELAAYEYRRNAAAQPIQWRFTTDRARLKLHRLYPSTPL